jgi:hypothetical protein
MQNFRTEIRGFRIALLGDQYIAGNEIAGGLCGVVEVERGKPLVGFVKPVLVDELSGLAQAHQ